MRPRSLKGRLTLVLVATVGLMAALVGIGALGSVRSDLLRRTDEQVRALFGPAVGRLRVPDGWPSGAGSPRPDPPTGFPTRPDPGVPFLGVPPGSVAELVEGGSITRRAALSVDLTATDSATAVPTGVSEPAGPELESLIGRAARTGGVALGTFSAGDGEVRVGAVAGARPGSGLIVRFPLDGVQRTLSQLRATLVTAGLVATVLAALAGWGLIGWGLAGLGRVTAAARRIAGGQRGLRVGGREGATEVQDLSTAFDAMLEEWDRSESRLRQFVADAAHELRTPLASLQGHSELLVRLDSEADRARSREHIASGAERLGSLVEQLVTLARLDASAPLEWVPVDLAEVVAAATADARVRHVGHHFATPAPEGAPEAFVVAGDPHRLRQLVDNLLENAGRHTPSGSLVSVELARSGDEVVLRVTDDGPGVPEGFDPFERFARADASRAGDTGGSGLGLAIVRAIAQGHGGWALLDRATGGCSVRVGLRCGPPPGGGPPPTYTGPDPRPDAPVRAPDARMARVEEV